MQSGVTEMDSSDIINQIVSMAEASFSIEPGDYVDDEGYIVCGRCHTRRQTEIVLDTKGEKKAMRVPSLCNCRARAMEEEAVRRRERQDMEAVKSMRRQSLMDARLVKATFSTFQKTAANERVLTICERYAAKFTDMLDMNQGLLFYGDTGTGKTFSAACIANELLDRGVSVVMTSFVKLLSAQMDDVLMARMNRVKLLIIDDLGAERSTDYALEFVYNVIDARYRAKRPLILTTNLSLADMKQNSDIRYARIYDRIFEMCFPVEFDGRSWRKAEAARRFDAAKKLLEV